MKTLDSPTLLKTWGANEIWFVPLVEDIPLEDMFVEDDIFELQERINSYQAVYFCAKVYVKINGVELNAASYLGGCYYDSFEEFYRGNDYIVDMIQEVEIEARKELDGLVKQWEDFKNKNKQT